MIVLIYLGNSNSNSDTSCSQQTSCPIQTIPPTIPSTISPTIPPITLPEYSTLNKLFTNRNSLYYTVLSFHQDDLNLLDEVVESLDSGPESILRLFTTFTSQVMSKILYYRLSTQSIISSIFTSLMAQVSDNFHIHNDRGYLFLKDKYETSTSLSPQILEALTSLNPNYIGNVTLPYQIPSDDIALFYERTNITMTKDIYLHNIFDINNILFTLRPFSL